MAFADLRKLSAIQRAVAAQVEIDGSINPEEINLIAGFDCAYCGDKIICAAVVINAKTLSIVESKQVVIETPMPYISGFLAFREGPAIIRAYYELEHEPDVLMIEGHGIAHPLKCGLASYVGVELNKPAIGIAKGILAGHIVDGNIILDGEAVGKMVATRQHSNPLCVSIGHLMNIDAAVELVKQCISFPHKLPEPIHVAHRISSREADRMRSEQCKLHEETKKPAIEA